MPAPMPTRPLRTSADEWVALRCEHCEVSWRGLPDAPCWACGGDGVVASTATLVLTD